MHIFFNWMSSVLKMKMCESMRECVFMRDDLYETEQVYCDAVSLVEATY